MDRRAGAAAAAREACRGLEVEAVVAPAEATGLRDGTVAAVLVVRLLGHVADPEAVLTECARILAAGGVALVADWDEVALPAAGFEWEELPPPPGGWAALGSHLG